MASSSVVPSQSATTLHPPVTSTWQPNSFTTCCNAIIVIALDILHDSARGQQLMDTAQAKHSMYNCHCPNEEECAEHTMSTCHTKMCHLHRWVQNQLKTLNAQSFFGLQCTQTCRGRSSLWGLVWLTTDFILLTAHWPLPDFSQCVMLPLSTHWTDYPLHYHFHHTCSELVVRTYGVSSFPLHSQNPVVKIYPLPSCNLTATVYSRYMCLMCLLLGCIEVFPTVY